MDSETCNYRINPKGVASENFGTETVVINIKRGYYYSLNTTTALFIWNLLDHYPTEEYILKIAFEAFVISDPDQAKTSISKFLQQLLDEELIVVTQENIQKKEVVMPSANSKFEIPTVEIFDDMQELITLDPIHDVDAQKGWPNKK